MRVEFLLRQKSRRDPVTRKDRYAFKCTEQGGSELIETFRGSGQRCFIACTVDLLATRVDIERLNAVCFFRYLDSAILFYQMVGRGTHIHQDTAKYKFWLYDYTGVARLFGTDFITAVRYELLTTCQRSGFCPCHSAHESVSGAFRLALEQAQRVGTPRKRPHPQPLAPGLVGRRCLLDLPNRDPTPGRTLDRGDPHQDQPGRDCALGGSNPAAQDRLFIPHGLRRVRHHHGETDGDQSGLRQRSAAMHWTRSF